jgi:hypothetical protein
MRIADIFTMGDGSLRRPDTCDNDCYYGYIEPGEGSESLTDPRLRRSGLAAIIGSRADGGSGLAGLFKLED